MTSPDVRVLEKTYEALVFEATRLRDARRQVTSQLGPLPSSAAVIIALFVALAEGSAWWTPFALAAGLAPFLGIVLISSRFSRGKPARAWLDEMSFRTGSHDGAEYGAWLVSAIASWRRVNQELVPAFERELKGLRIVQVLLAIEVMYLVGVSAVASRVP